MDFTILTLTNNNRGMTMTRKASLILISFIILFLIIGCSKNVQVESIKNGEITIPSTDEIIKLSGEWSFYPNQILSPEEINSNKNLIKGKMTVPGYWEERTGYGTYELKMYFPKSTIGQTFAINIPQVFSAYTLWLNNDLLIENGKVGKSRSETIPKGVPKTIYYKVPVNQEVIVLLQISNFNYHSTGIMGPIYLGKRPL